MTKQDYADVFNKFLNNIPVSFNETLFPIILEYLTDTKEEKEIPLLEKQIKENPQIVSGIMRDVIDHIRRKYFILSVIKNNQTILFYVTD